MPGERQQLARQAFSTLGCGLYSFDGPWQFRIKQAREDLGTTANDHQQIVEVVRDAAGQFADRLHFLSHRELLARLDQFLVRITSLCRVLKYIGKTDQMS